MFQTNLHPKTIRRRSGHTSNARGNTSHSVKKMADVKTNDGIADEFWFTTRIRIAITKGEPIANIKTRRSHLSYLALKRAVISLVLGAVASRHETGISRAKPTRNVASAQPGFDLRIHPLQLFTTAIPLRNVDSLPSLLRGFLIEQEELVHPTPPKSPGGAETPTGLNSREEPSINFNP